ncbi:MAG: hypothetical protein ACTXOO_04945 [Sodalis sp. (in: enterobacteria)]
MATIYLEALYRAERLVVIKPGNMPESSALVVAGVWPCMLAILSTPLSLGCDRAEAGFSTPCLGGRFSSDSRIICAIRLLEIRGNNVDVNEVGYNFIIA